MDCWPKKWLLLRGGHEWRFDCVFMCVLQNPNFVFFLTWQRLGCRNGIPGEMEYIRPFEVNHDQISNSPFGSQA